MAKKRKFVAYRRIERPYTRVSKYRKVNYVRGKPHSVISQHHMGNRTRKFPRAVAIFAKNGVQIRQSAIEAARQACNRKLDKTIGKENYHLHLRIYPHHILRENPLASGAGADRMSTGMQKSFGKVKDRAAQVKPGKELFMVEVLDDKGINTAKDALRLAGHKFPTSCSIKVIR